MTFLSEPDLASLRQQPPGLELLRYWCGAADRTDEVCHKLLSYMVSGLVGRGWLQTIDKSLDAAADTLDEPRSRLERALYQLVQADLVAMDGQKVLALAGLFSTRPTGCLLAVDGDHSVHLLGPMAALAATVALRRTGEVRATCQRDPKRRILLRCDDTGVHSREPEGVCLFLPAWDGARAPSFAMTEGGLFADDDALGRWQEDHGDPPGMPLASQMFPMAAADLGGQLGRGLEALLNHLPDFD